MKLRILSDLHLEHHKLELKPGEEDIVVLAGDIHLGTKGLEWAIETFNVPIIFCPGNHEFYGQGEIIETMERIWQFANKHENVFQLVHPGDTCHIDGVRFIGGTLWTDFMLDGEANMVNSMCSAMRGLNDYYAIMDHGRALGATRTQQLHRDFLKGMAENYGKSVENTVVAITHMAPSSRSSLRKYIGDCLNPAYASRLEQWIVDRPKIKLWVHGHMHNSSDYMIGGCRVVANPRGYASPNRQENSVFNPNLIVEV